jgi:hypothetical protein
MKIVAYVFLLFFVTLIDTFNALQLTLHNPNVFQYDYVNDDTPTYVEFSLKISEDERFNHITSNTKISTICFQHNGFDCHCYHNIYDIASYQFIIPINCKMKSFTERLYISVKLVIPNGESIISTPEVITNLSRTSNANIINNRSIIMDLSYSISLVLPLTLDDLARAVILLSSLRNISTNSICELLIVAPDVQIDIIHATLKGVLMGNVNDIRDNDNDNGNGNDNDNNICDNSNSSLTIPLRMIPESSLFSDPKLFHKNKNNAYSYSIQMAIKLLIAKVVKTQFYLTLDADVILLRPSKLHEILLVSNSNKMMDNDNGNGNDGNEIIMKGIYEDESRDIHPSWWTGSANLLNIPVSTNVNKINVLSTDIGDGFSVTPAVLNTFGSLLTLAEIVHTHQQCVGVGVGNSNKDTIDIAKAEIIWIESFGKELICQNRSQSIDTTNINKDTNANANTNTNTIIVWSEYTLYRLTLDKYHLFNEFHVVQNNTAKLHCYDIWYKEQLPWNMENAYNSGCIFSVVQSSTNFSPSKLWEILRK